MKFTAQTSTKMAMAAAMARRLGARLVDDAIFTGSNQSLFADREFFDEVEPRLEPDTGPRGDANRPLRRYCDFGRDDVFRPIPLAGRHVPWQQEVGQRGKSNKYCVRDRCQIRACPRTTPGCRAASRCRECGEPG